MGFSTAYKYYVLAVMTAVYTFNIVDRGLMILLLQPIKEDLQLSDTQLGLLTGIAFGFFYAILGIPIARLADRRNRATITAAAIGLWGLTVMGCLFVTSYFQLVVARIAAGVGESGGKPPSYSLVGDYFPGAVERTRAMTVYWLSSPLAWFVSFILGGWICAHYGWRMTFFIMGSMGLAFALLVKLTVKEPRTLAGNPALRDKPLPSFAEVAKILWGQRSSRHLSLALILLYTMGLGLSPWYAAFLTRSHGMSTAELGTWLGIIFSASGVIGVLLGGYVSNRWFAGNERGQMRLAAVAIASQVPFYVAFLTVPQKHQALIVLLPLTIAFNFFLAPTYALMQRLVPDEMRATTMAVVMLFANLIGMGLGPQIVGILSDALKPSLGTDSLRYAMVCVSFVALWSAYHFWKVGQSVANDLPPADCHT